MTGIKTNDWNSLQGQQRLAAFYSRCLSDPSDYTGVPDSLEELAAVRQIEDGWMAQEEKRAQRLSKPSSVAEFRSWYLNMHHQHCEVIQPFFAYLSDRAPIEDLAFYICLEEMVDGHFDDVIALSQLGVQGYAKIVMAENYWDEMGHGKPEDVHTAMFSVSADYMKDMLRESGIFLPQIVPLEALKNANILLFCALRRRYVPRLLGAIGILEHTAPRRFAAVVDGLRRIGAPDYVIRYHEAHVDFDAAHGAEWFDHVLLPMAHKSTELMNEIILGILMRYRIAVDYYRSVETQIDQMKHLSKQSA